MFCSNCNKCVQPSTCVPASWHTDLTVILNDLLNSFPHILLQTWSEDGCRPLHITSTIPWLLYPFPMYPIGNLNFSSSLNKGNHFHSYSKSLLALFPWGLARAFDSVYRGTSPKLMKSPLFNFVICLLWSGTPSSISIYTPFSCWYWKSFLIWSLSFFNRFKVLVILFDPSYR